MTAPNSNNNIQSSAEYTVQIAKKELGKTLDYSANSLKDLDALIEHVKKHFSRLIQEGKLSDQIVQRASTSIGAYLGEVIRKHYGGTWVAKNAVMKTLVINKEEISPVHYIFQRLTQNSDYGLEKYWFDISQKVKPQNKDGASKVFSEFPEKELSPSVGRNDNKLLLIGGIVILAIICLTGVAVTMSSNIKANKANIEATKVNIEFKSKLNPFLAEAEKLNVMTEQGVTYQEFRNQYFEVKASYALIDSWPSSNQDEQMSFDNALKGWKLTLDVWEIGLKAYAGVDASFFPDDHPLIGEIASYTGINYVTVNFMIIGDSISVLMEKASTYFEEGKAGVK